jgi:hypothetical protein
MQLFLLIFYVTDTAVEKIEINKVNTKKQRLNWLIKKD